LNGDFQNNYLAAEQAYAAGDFQAARSLVLTLLDHLEPLPASKSEQDAALAWRAFVALLAGHIHLYGLNETGEARSYYELVLASNPQDTLQDLAEQGLERSMQGQTIEINAEPLPVDESSGLIRDPFLKQSPDSIQADQPETASPPPSAAAAATPWLMESPSKQSVTTTSAIQDKAFGKTEAEETIVEDSVAVAVLAIRSDESQLLEMDPQEIHPMELPQAECQEDRMIQQALKQRLEAGRLRVKLPDQSETSTKVDAGNFSATGKWSWLLAALRRS
tara:strand:+ start:412 stop:1242 length:831 start_codon:yes stop_codon:yes gene_type:complete